MVWLDRVCQKRVFRVELLPWEVLDGNGTKDSIYSNNTIFATILWSRKPQFLGSVLAR